MEKIQVLFPAHQIKDGQYDVSKEFNPKNIDEAYDPIEYNEV